MLSLDNAFSVEALRDFDRRVHERLQDSVKVSYLCEPKLDGVAVSLIYKEGMLVQAALKLNVLDESRSSITPQTIDHYRQRAREVAGRHALG
jgi:hypothetical protein